MKDRDARVDIAKLEARVKLLEGFQADFEAKLRAAQGSFYRKMRGDDEIVRQDNGSRSNYPDELVVRPA